MSALAETGDAPSLQRARGRVAASVTASGGPLRLGRLHQSGCLKLRFPRLADRSLEGVLINTAGGLTGGDRVEQAYAVGEDAALTVTTQAAERIYRASADEARVLSRLEVAEAATLAFLPQETILFEGGRLRRRLEVDLAASSRLLLCESVILGRTLMGETVRDGLLHDSWRVRRDGRLVFAEELRLGGAIDRLAAGPATLAGHRAFATLLVQDPAAEALLGEARALLPAAGGASLVAGLLVLRLAAPTGFELRRSLVPLIAALAKRPLPRVWSL